MLRSSFLLILLLMLIRPGTLCSQGSQLMRGWSGSEDYQNITSMANGDYLLIGNITDTVFNYTDIFLTRYDSNHTEKWTRIYDFSNSDYAYQAVEDGQGGFLITGYVTQGLGNLDLLVFRVDGLGNVDWARNYGGNDLDQGKAIQQTPMGNYLVGGVTQSFSVDGNADMYLMKLDVMGNIVWSRTYGGNMLDRLEDIVIINEDEFLLIGASYTYIPGTPVSLMIRTDVNGNPSWSTAIKGLNFSWAREGELLGDGFLVAGEMQVVLGLDGDFMLAKVDLNGNVRKLFTYDSGGNELGRSMAVSDKGKVWLAGLRNDFGPRGPDGMILETDTSGQVSWSGAFGTPQQEIFRAIDTTFGGLMAVGYSDYEPSMGLINSEGIHVITDQSGNIPCDQPAFTTTSYSLIPMDFSFHPQVIVTTNISTQFTNATASVLDTTILEKEVCISVSTEESSGEEPLSLFPNPTQGSCSVSGWQGIHPLSLKISDVHGKMVTEHLFQPGQAPSLSLRGLSAGIYFYQLFQTDKPTAKAKLILID